MAPVAADAVEAEPTSNPATSAEALTITVAARRAAHRRPIGVPVRCGEPKNEARFG
jgi:hypothetical protein